MDHVLGQPRAVDLLQASLQSDRVHHAFIFHGPQGVGKFTTARAFAKVLLCHDRQTDLAGRVVACDACASCTLLSEKPAPASPPKPEPPKTRASKSKNADEPATPARPDPAAQAHPDFHVVTKELARFSDDRAVRERKLMTIPVDVLETRLLTPVYRVAQLGHGKVVILDEAELLNLDGQNKLLKTLEEPPAGTVIILITASEERLLPTIRSRCQRIAFVPLADEIVEDMVRRKHPDLPDPQRRWLVDFAQGSLGRAELATSFNLFKWADAVLPRIDMMSPKRFPGDLGAAISTLIGEFAEAWVGRHENASKDAANKLAASLMFSMIARHARRKLAQAAATSQGDPAQLATLLEPWLGVIDALTRVETELAANVNPGLAMDHLVSHLFRAMNHRPALSPVP